jgi:hypothetical protein
MPSCDLYAEFILNFNLRAPRTRKVSANSRVHHESTKSSSWPIATASGAISSWTRCERVKLIAGSPCTTAAKRRESALGCRDLRYLRLWAIRRTREQLEHCFELVGWPGSVLREGLRRSDATRRRRYGAHRHHCFSAIENPGDPAGGRPDTRNLLRRPVRAGD